MFKRFSFSLLAMVLPFVFFSCGKEDPYRRVVIDFQNVAFSGTDLYINNAGVSGFFMQENVKFPNSYEEFGGGEYFWSGFAYSKAHDLTTSSKINQYSVFVDESDDNVFAVVSVFDPSPPDFPNRTELNFVQPVRDLSFDVANSTYSALVMRDGGDGMGKQFGNDDWFHLLIQLYDENDNPLFVNGSNEAEPVVVPLAKGTDIVDSWINVAFKGKADVSKIEFIMESSDNNAWGMLTPAYFCIDNIKFKTLK